MSDFRLYALRTRQPASPQAHANGCPSTGWIHAVGPIPWCVLVHTEPGPLAAVVDDRWGECWPELYTGHEPVMWLADYLPQNVRENVVPQTHLEACRNLLCTDPVHDPRPTGAHA